MDWASASVTQAGFSTSTCLPAAAAASTWGAWVPDEQISTASMSEATRSCTSVKRAASGNVKVVADLPQQVRRDVADAADLEAVAPVAQVRQMLNLSDRPASNDAYS